VENWFSKLRLVCSLSSYCQHKGILQLDQDTNVQGKKVLTILTNNKRFWLEEQSLNNWQDQFSGTL
ncbi:uncharacterized protein METZ01_LOCUS57655, partial [marine metagenome]